MANTEQSVHDAIKALFRHQEEQVRPFSSIWMVLLNRYALNEPTGLTSPSVENGTLTFFKDIFPILYPCMDRQEDCEKGTVPKQHLEYSMCLQRQALDALDGSRGFAKELAEALKLARHALSTLTTLMSALDFLLAKSIPLSTECEAALTRLDGCFLCSGLETKPKVCSGFCTNVISGCIQHRFGNLHIPFDKTVSYFRHFGDELYTGKRLNIDEVLRTVNGRLHDILVVDFAKRQREISEGVKNLKFLLQVIII